MKDNFDLKKFLYENKVTKHSALVTENQSVNEGEDFRIYGHKKGEQRSDEKLLFSKAKTSEEAKRAADVLEKKYNMVVTRIGDSDLDGDGSDVIDMFKKSVNFGSVNEALESNKNLNALMQGKEVDDVLYSGDYFVVKLDDGTHVAFDTVRAKKVSPEELERINELFDDEDFWKSERAKEQEKYGKEGGEEDHIEEAAPNDQVEQFKSDELEDLFEDALYDLSQKLVNGLELEGEADRSRDGYAAFHDGAYKYIGNYHDATSEFEFYEDHDIRLQGSYYNADGYHAINDKPTVLLEVIIDGNIIAEVVFNVESMEDLESQIDSQVNKLESEWEASNWQPTEKEDDLDDEDTIDEAIEMSTDDIIVYDNGGESFDRYTVFLGDDVFGFSDTGRGFNQYVGDTSQIQPGEHLGTEVDFDTLNDELKAAIMQRAQDEGDLDESTFQSPTMAQLVDSKPYKDLQRKQQFGIITPEEFDKTMELIKDKAIDDDGEFSEKIASKIVANVKKTGKEPGKEKITSMAWDHTKSKKGRRMSNKEKNKVFKEEYTPGDMWYSGIEDDFVDFIENNPLENLDSDTLRKLADTAEDINYHSESALLSAMADLRGSKIGEQIKRGAVNLYNKLSSVTEERTVESSLEEVQTAKIIYKDKDGKEGSYKTSIADGLSNKDVRDYYVGKTFDLSSGAEGEPEKLVKVVDAYITLDKGIDETINEEHIQEASSSDVIKAFYKGNSADSKKITTNGKELKTTGIGGRTIAKKVGDKYQIVVDTPDSKIQQSVIKAIKKYIPSDLMMESKQYKFRLKK